MRRNRKVETVSQLFLIETAVVFRSSTFYGNHSELKIQDTTDIRKIEQ